MRIAKEKLLAAVDSLINEGNALRATEWEQSMIGGFEVMNPRTYVDLEAAARWHAGCQHLVRMLRHHAEPWQKSLNSSGNLAAVVRSKLGTLQGIKSAIERDLLCDEPDDADQPPASSATAHGAIHVAGNYIANHQVNSPHATQHVSVSINQQMLETVGTLKAALNSSDVLDDHDKDELRHLLDRLCELAKREKSEKNTASINDKLTTIVRMIPDKLAPVAMPWIYKLRDEVEAQGH